MKRKQGLKRREFLVGSGVLASAVATGIGHPLRVLAAPAIIASGTTRPVLAQGMQIGDVEARRAMIWTRSDRPARLWLEWDTSEGFPNPRRLRGPHALSDSDYTARVDLPDLPPGETIFVRVYGQSLENDRAFSEPVIGRFRTAPADRNPVRFLWSGDTAGQGFGINPDIGGMRMYETMRQRQPDFFIHSGDTIYADNPIEPEIVVEDGKIWRNITTPEKSKVAETLDEFRGAYKYNLLDDNVRRFNAEVPQIWQWDDHEVVNNWSPSSVLGKRYTVRDVRLLAARGARAFLEYAPLRPYDARESERIYRHIPYGPSLDVFCIDMRSYRGPNTYNRQEMPNDETTFLDRPQLHWLKQGLLHSSATWKVIAADMPLGLLVRDGQDPQGRPRFEAVANGDGPPLGREFEVRSLLRFIKHNRIRNVVWLTADVHYTAAHHYDPARAQFTDFEPFWEFVSGPINAASFGPASLDNTFGPEVVFQKPPPAQHYSPLGGYQFFGQVDIERGGEAMTVSLLDIAGTTLFEKTLHAGH